MVFLRPNFEKYEASSQKILEITKRHVPLVEQASIDEFYLDMSFAGNYVKVKEISESIKKEIKEEEKLTASIGIAPNKLVAKIASDMQKPDGLTMVTDAGAFLEPLSIRKIPGVGPKTEEVLIARNVKTVKDAKKFTKDELRDMFGKWGTDLYYKLRGVDDAPVVEKYETKSIGEQETFMTDTRDAEFILERVKKMCGEIIERLGANGFAGFRTVAITVRFADFETKSKSHTFGQIISVSNPRESVLDPRQSAASKLLEFEAIKLLMPFLDKRENPRNKLIRLIGVRIERFND